MLEGSTAWIRGIGKRSVDDAWELFSMILNAYIDHNTHRKHFVEFPLKPWITQDLQMLIRHQSCCGDVIFVVGMVLIIRITDVARRTNEEKLVTSLDRRKF